MKKKKFLINCMCCLALAVGTGGVSTMASDMNVEFTADEGNAVDDTDISAFSEGEEIGDDATQPQDIGIVEDETEDRETENEEFEDTVLPAAASDDFEIEDGVLVKYHGTERDVLVVPDNVTTIGLRAFSTAYARKIVLGENVKVIESEGFAGSGVHIVEMPYVTTIESEAFRNCGSLEKVEFGNELKTIDYNAFENCENLGGELTIPESVTKIGDEAFCNTRIEKVTFLCTDITYGVSIFSRNDSLKEMYIYGGTLPSWRTSEPWSAESLEKVYIGSNVKSLGYHAFSRCAKLQDVTIEPGQYDTIGFATFSGCTSLKHIVIPDNIKKIEGSAFSETGLEEIDLNQVTELGGGSFMSCKSLSSVKWDHVTSVGQGCFLGCESIKELVLPQTLVSMYSDSFLQESSLEKVTVTGKNTELQLNAFRECENLKIIDVQAARKVEGYLPNSRGWTLLIGNDVAEIGRISGDVQSLVINGDENLNLNQNAFNGITALKSVHISGKVTLSDYCFSGCENLADVTFENGPAVIGRGAFAGDKSITELILPEGVTEIDVDAFKEMTALKELIVPDSVTILQRGFLRNSGVEKLTVPHLGEDGRIGKPEELPGLKEITIKSGIISSLAFEGYTNLKSVVLGDKVTEIGHRAFLNCPALNKVTVPASVKNIGEYAFGTKAVKRVEGNRVYYDKYEPAFPKEKFKLSGYADTAAEKYAESTEGIEFIDLGGTVRSYKVTVSKSSVIYNGKSQEIGVTVKQGSKTLKKNTDYTVTYKNNKNIGTATITVTGKGKYKGITAKATFKITLPEKQKVTVSKITYRVTNAAVNGKGTVSVKGITDKKTRTSLTIGKTVKIGGVSYKITGIDSSAFANASKLKSVTIGSNVRRIGAKAFYNCKSLAKVTVNTSKLTDKNVGANAFKGIKATCTFKVPKAKISAYKKLFKAKGAGAKIKVTG